MKLILSRLLLLTFFIQTQFPNIVQGSPLNQETIIQTAGSDEAEGFWGPWATCGPNTYAIGFKVKAQNKNAHFQSWDNFGISGVELMCGMSGNKSVKGISTIRSNIAEEGEWTKMEFCEGYLVGFEAKIENSMINGDSVGPTNLGFKCSKGKEKIWQNLDFQPGIWSDMNLCMKNQAICGIRTKTKLTFDDEDRIGISALKFECCDFVPRSVSCFPTDGFELLFDFDNTMGLQPVTYSYSLTIGVTRTNTKNDEFVKNKVANSDLSLATPTTNKANEVKEQRSKREQFYYFGPFEQPVNQLQPSILNYGIPNTNEGIRFQSPGQQNFNGGFGIPIDFNVRRPNYGNVPQPLGGRSGINGGIYSGSEFQIRNSVGGFYPHGGFQPPSFQPPSFQTSSFQPPSFQPPSFQPLGGESGFQQPSESKVMSGYSGGGQLANREILNYQTTFLPPKNDKSENNSNDEKVEKTVQNGDSNYLPNNSEERESVLKDIYSVYVESAAESLTSGYNWGSSSSSTWAPARTTRVSMTILPGHAVSVYQVVGICGDFIVRPEKIFQNGTFLDKTSKASNKTEKANPMGDIYYYTNYLAGISTVFQNFFQLSRKVSETFKLF